MKKILFFDAETTGLPGSMPRLVQLACLLTDENGNELETYYSLVRPDGYRIPQEATAIHGITTEKATAEGRNIGDILTEFSRLYNECDMYACHNISFNTYIMYLEYELIQAAVPFQLSPKPAVCTMEGSKKFVGIWEDYLMDYKWPKLSELHQKLFGCGFKGAHDALCDIRATAKCYFELVRLGVDLGHEEPNCQWQERVFAVSLSTAYYDDLDNGEYWFGPDLYNWDWQEMREKLMIDHLMSTRSSAANEWPEDFREFATDVPPPSDDDPKAWKDWFQIFESEYSFDFPEDIEEEASQLVLLEHDYITGISAIVCQDGSILEHVCYLTDSDQDDMPAILAIVARMWRRCNRRYIFDHDSQGYVERLLRKEVAAATAAMPGSVVGYIDHFPDALSGSYMLAAVEKELSS